MSVTFTTLPIDARVTPANADKWQEAYAWGDHAEAGYAEESALLGHTGRTDNPHAVTATQVGADAVGAADAVQSNLNAHSQRIDNPHQVTPAQIGADAAGAATSAINSHMGAYNHADIADGKTAHGWGDHALAGYAQSSELAAHEQRVDNPHQVTAEQVGADAAGTAAGLVAEHEGAYVHGDIAHANRAILDGLNQALGTGAAPTFGGLVVDGKSVYKDDDVIMPTNPFGGRKLYISSLHNAAFRAESRWVVTAKQYKKSDDSFVSDYSVGVVANLFNGSYDDWLTVDEGNYAVITIDFSTESDGAYPFYPYGYVYLSHFHTSHSESASMRVYCNYEPQGVGWKTLAFEDFLREPEQLILKSEHQTFFRITVMEITVTAKDTGKAYLTEIDWQLDRPYTNEMPIVDKYRANILYSSMFFENGSGTRTVEIQNATGRIGSNKSWPTAQIHAVSSATYRPVVSAQFAAGATAGGVQVLNASGTVLCGMSYAGDNAFYFGPQATDATWRIVPSGNDLHFQRRESGAWVTKGAITA